MVSISFGIGKGFGFGIGKGFGFGISWLGWLRLWLALALALADLAYSVYGWQVVISSWPTPFMGSISFGIGKGFDFGIGWLRASWLPSL